MEEWVRCPKCGHKLMKIIRTGRGIGATIEIKCSSCKAVIGLPPCLFSRLVTCERCEESVPRGGRFLCGFSFGESETHSDSFWCADGYRLKDGLSFEEPELVVLQEGR